MGTQQAAGAVTGRTRDRRGRGMRGPAVLPDVAGRPALPTGRERFDALVVDAVQALERRWHERLGLVEYAVEDAPQLSDEWIESWRAGLRDDSVPMSSLVRPAGDGPARIVVFRRPVEHRCESRRELRALVHDLVVERVAELLDLPPEEVDPGYGTDPP